MLHESDLKKFLRCDKYYWYSKQKSVPYIPFVTHNYDIYELIQEYLGLENPFIGQKGDDTSKTLDAYHEGKDLVNARISYRDFRINIPCLVQKENKKILYLVYSNCHPKYSETQKIHDLLKVMEINGIEHDEIYLLYINQDYVRKETFDVHECLIIGDEFYNDRYKKCGKIMDHVNACERDLDNILDQIEALGDMSDVKKTRSSICTSHYKCEFFNECFPEFHDTSIMNLAQSSKKYDCLEMGIDDMAQVMGDEIEGNRVQYAQIMAAKKQGLFVDKFALMGWLSKITYPITYLDFEWQTYVYPPYQGMKPLDVLVFQYSMHVEDENGNLTHEEYIGKGDCRVEFIEDLIAKIPSTGTILVFNAQGAEVLRLQQLAEQFPQYEEQLRGIWERMLDLSLPFSCGLIYDVRMAGEYNLKKLLSLFSDLSYDELEINQGLLAVKKYRELENEENEDIKQALYKYCEMDTYAEYVLYHYLKDLVKK